MKEYILAHDLGTSGNKAVLYAQDGSLIGSSVSSYPTAYPAPGQVEQSAEDWWQAVCRSSRDVLEQTGINPGQIACVVFSGQMMGCLPMDREGTPLRPALIWADTRATDQEARMLKEAGMERVYRITGHRASASYTAAKWLWIDQQEPETASKTHKLLQAKDFIVYRMTDRFVTDYSDASGTNLLDITEKRWSAELCAAFGISSSILPELLPSTSVAGPINKAAADACGLLPGTPVVLGGGDGSCACVGAGALAPGDAYHVLGSSSWISGVSVRPLFDPSMRTFNWVHLNPDLYTPCGTMQAAGCSYQWLRDQLRVEFDQLNAEAAASSPGAGGILFLPYLLGERSPRWDAEVRGSFLGLSQSTTRGDLARAVMEGVAMNLKIILDILSAQMPLSALSVIGGGALTPVWLQILSDVWKKPLLLPAHPRQATGMGAAICGAVALGMLPSWQDAAEWNQPESTVRPSENAAIYEDLFPIFDRAYHSLLGVNGNLHAFRMGKENQ